MIGKMKTQNGIKLSFGRLRHLAIFTKPLSSALENFYAFINVSLEGSDDFDFFLRGIVLFFCIPVIFFSYEKWLELSCWGGQHGLDHAKDFDVLNDDLYGPHTCRMCGEAFKYRRE